MYEVKMPYSADSSRTGAGAVISRHRTAEAAYAAIDRENRQVRRRAGQSTSWVDRYVWDAKAGKSVPRYEI